jgi:hypothetical protein
MLQNETAQLVAKAFYNDGFVIADVTKQAVYSSSNEQVAVVSESGLVTALDEGETIISAVYGAQEMQASVTVTAVPIVLPIVTTAYVSGTMRSGWYTQPVTVTLTTNNGPSSVISTVYNTDGSTTWSAYTEPVVLTESGIHALHYHSFNDAGQKEQTKSVPIPIDNIVPQYVVAANGSPLSDITVLQDDMPITLTLTASDPLSGVVRKSMTITDATYGNGTYADSAVIDWAGRPGEHIVFVEVEDTAGNTVSASVTVIVETSLDSIEALLERYIGSGDVSGPLISQLSNSLKQVRHHMEKGSEKQAAKHLDNFLKHLYNGPMQQHVSADAKAVLSADTEYMIELWS